MFIAKLGCRLKQLVQQDRRILITSAGVTVAVIILRLMGILLSSELAVLDQLFRLHPPEVNDKRIVIVEVSEADLQQIGKWPIPDQIMAQLIKKINIYQPRAIGLDIYRDLPVEPGHEEFIKVSETIPNLIGIERLKDTRSLGVSPPPVLSQNQQVGFNNIVVDADGKVRRSLLYLNIDGKNHESLALKLAKLYLEVEGIKPQASTLNSEYLQLGKGVFIPFHPDDGGYVQADAGGYQILADFRHQASFDTIALADVLAGKVPEQLLRDRIVLIGSKATSIEDLFYTPYSSRVNGTAIPFAGVELHANFISQILSAAIDGNSLIKVWSEPIEWLWIFGWSSLGAILIWQGRSQSSRLISLLFASVFLNVGCYLAFLVDWWLPLVPGLLGLLGSAAALTSYIAHTKEELKRSKEFLQTVINNIPDPVFVKDKKHRWIIVNQAYSLLVGYSLEALIGKSDYDIFPQQEADIFWNQDKLIFRTGEAREIEQEFTDASGKIHIVATKQSLHKDAAGNLFLVGVIRDITDRKRTEEALRQAAVNLARDNQELKLSGERLHYLANHDSLTGLANRPQFHERLTESLERACRNNQQMALMFIDLDGFKQVNDTLGHDTGDQLLKLVARRLTGSLRSSDIVSRLGGDEFTVILPSIPHQKYAARVADKILAVLSQVFVLEEQRIFVSGSIGISIYPLDGDTEDTLIKSADAAMYRAKQQGRNQRVFSHAL